MNLQISCHIRTFTLEATCLSLLAASLLACESAQAQNSSETVATYGRGVHAYFDNQTNLAEEYFSRVIRTGSTDPRVYYYRAMTRMRSGHQQEAEEDMRIGAAHEASNPGNRHAIGKALERVQGPHRRLLEKIRQQARMDRLQQRRQQTRRRYEQLQQREPAVLRREMPVPLEQLLEPSLDSPAQLKVPSARELSDSTAPATEERSPAPAPEVDGDGLFDEGPSDDDIFSEPKPRAEPAEQDDLFGEPAEETNPAPMEDDLFEDPEPDNEGEDPVQEEDDPFAAAAPIADPEESSSALLDESVPEIDPSMGRLQPSNQVESGQMVGILGRVVGSLFPWRSLEIPSMDLEAGSEVQQAGGVKFGPFDDQPEAIQVSAEEPLEGDADQEDFFGEVVGDSASEPADDPFGAGTTEEEQAPATDAAEEETSDSEATEPEFDDPFGEF